MSAESGIKRRWRLLDTGTRTAAENIAIDSVLLERRASGDTPDTLRFLKFAPAAALVGFHQSVDHEIRTDFCDASGIDINRRITGGGAVYFDASQIGWEIIASRDSLARGRTMAQLTGVICRAAARGLMLLGIPARFRPRNDIEVNGRKISGTGGAWEEDAFLFQGTLLVDFDVDTMLRALRVPTEKLARHKLDSARERVTCVRECLPSLPPEEAIKAAIAQGFAEHFGLEFATDELSRQERGLTDARLEKFSSPAWIRDTAEPAADHQLLTSVQLAPGGTIRTSAAFDIHRDRLKSVLFTGDFFISPRRSVYDLETRLRYQRLDDIDRMVNEFFDEEQPDCLGLDASDFIGGIAKARQKLSLTSYGLSPAEADAVSLVGGDHADGIDTLLPDVGALLLPYCAKRADCEFRYQEGCDECGECSVGDAYAIARGRGFEPITIQNYEHLESVFAACRRSGIRAYIGCCCEAFMVKRGAAFRDAGIAGILIGIEDETCYDLGREDAAYAGTFTGQTRIRTGILAAIVERRPGRGPLLSILPDSIEPGPGESG